MTRNQELKTAKKSKNDEFYTMLCDIEKEIDTYLKYIPNLFRNKIVLLPCDDPDFSQFTKYFISNFKKLGLKKLICTCIADANSSNGKILTVTNENSLSSKLSGNGDFRSNEITNLLKESDFVITNPPFSLFRDFVSWIFKENKTFLILGNISAVTYKEIFPLIKHNKMRLGNTIHSGDREFRVPNNYPLNAQTYRIDTNGNKYIRVKGVRWFTNIPYDKTNSPLSLMSLNENIKYSRHKVIRENGYFKYDNFDALDVPFTDAIPNDYDEILGVPITFLDKYCPEQFEIIGLGNSRENFTPKKEYINPKKHLKNGDIKNGSAINCVLTLLETKKPKNKIYYTSDNAEYLVPPYARILIKKKT